MPLLYLCSQIWNGFPLFPHGGEDSNLLWVSYAASRWCSKPRRHPISTIHCAARSFEFPSHKKQLLSGYTSSIAIICVVPAPLLLRDLFGTGFNARLLGPFVIFDLIQVAILYVLPCSGCITGLTASSSCKIISSNSWKRIRRSLCFTNLCTMLVFWWLGRLQRSMVI